MLALVAAGVQALAGLLATPQPRLAAVALGWQTAGLLGAIGALAWAFVQHDFSLVYVVQHSQRDAADALRRRRRLGRT